MYEILKSYSQHIIKKQSSIRDAMKKIDALGSNYTSIINYKFLVLLDDSNKLLGTITDGDIRRSILKGENLDSSVENAASLNPHFGILNRENENKNKLSKVINDTYFLPIVDKNNRLTGILIANNPYNKKVSVLLMAGGFGKRLGDKTERIPKPLIKKNGKALIDHAFDAINKSSNITEIFISTHYLSDLIKKHVNSKKIKVPVEIIYEKKPLGTAGALSIIENDKLGKDFLIINADLVTNLDLDNLITFHNLSRNDATIAVARYVYKVPYGVIEYSSNGSFLGLIEKPDINKYVSAGIYILSNKFKDLLPKMTVIDMPDLINKGHKKGLSVGVFPIHEEWSDIGRPEDL